MEGVEELKKWIAALTVGEKRYINLLGKSRAGARHSQQLELLDWLNRADDAATIPPDASFVHNLPTVVARLKELILDGLRLLHQDANVDAQLRTALDHLALLHDKKLYPPAMRLLKRAKRQALATCRYAQALACIEWEHKLLRGLAPANLMEQLKALRAEEEAVLAQLRTLQDLRYRNERLLFLVRHISLPRNPATAAEVEALTTGAEVVHLSQHGRYVERALAVNILGIKQWFDRNPMEAVALYEQLLLDWRDHPDWQVDQAPLLLTICNYFQTACFYSKMDWEEARRYLKLVPDFKVLAPHVARDFQRMLYHNQLTPALNTGNFESVQALIPEIDHWLAQQQAHLSAAQLLPFYHNFAVAQFLMGNHLQANRYLQRILNTPNRKVRVDIQEFALVLQAVVRYEMGDLQLIEYLTRAGKRHFTKHTRELAFELAVFNYLEAAMRADPTTDLQASLDKLIAALDGLAEQLPGTVPLLGLTEMQLWAQSKRNAQSVTALFLQAVRENLEAMG